MVHTCVHLLTIKLQNPLEQMTAGGEDLKTVMRARTLNAKQRKRKLSWLKLPTWIPRTEEEVCILTSMCIQMILFDQQNLISKPRLTWNISLWIWINTSCIIYVQPKFCEVPIILYLITANYFQRLSSLLSFCSHWLAGLFVTRNFSLCCILSMAMPSCLILTTMLCLAIGLAFSLSHKWTGFFLTIFASSHYHCCALPHYLHFLVSHRIAVCSNVNP